MRLVSSQPSARVERSAVRIVTAMHDGTYAFAPARPRWAHYGVALAVILLVNALAFRLYRSRAPSPAPPPPFVATAGPAADPRPSAPAPVIREVVPEPALREAVAFAESRPHEPKRHRPAKFVAERAHPAPPAEEPAAPAPGVILVSSAPPGFLVELDGKRVDLTPARVPAEPGNHTIALLRGGTRVMERRVQVESGAVASIDADLREEPVPSGPAPAPIPVPAAAPPAPLAVPAPSRPEPLPPAEDNAPGRGELYVVCPDIDGEVFINGKAYGAPPLVAKDVPTGPAVVAISVDGVARRTMTVQVRAQGRTTVRIR